MTFYEKYESLCREEGFKPQSPEMMRMTGVSSGAISGWKGGSLPKTEVIVRIARHFGVSSDYLLGLSEERGNLTDEDRLILDCYHSASVEDRFTIIQTCMNAKKKATAVV